MFEEPNKLFRFVNIHIMSSARFHRYVGVQHIRDKVDNDFINGSTWFIVYIRVLNLVKVLICELQYIIKVL